VSPIAGLAGLDNMPSNPSLPHAAYCEEYNEDAHTTIPETRQSANVAAKRSKPDVVKTRLPEATRDEFSDSGYSSRTGATLGSGDSSLASKTDAVPLDAGIDVAEGNKPRIIPHKEAQSPPQSFRKPTLRRTDSKARGGPRQQEDYDSQERAATIHQSARPLEKGHPAGSQVVKQAPRPPLEVSSKPASTKPLPPSPTHQAPILQPAQVRPRVTTSQSYRTGRPMSFHAGVTPQISYMPPLYIPSVAYSTPAPPQPAHPSQTAAYFVPQQSPLHPQTYPFPPSPYDPQPRPPTRQWTSAQPQPYSHSLVYSPAPVLNYTQRPTYSQRTVPTQHATQTPTAQTVDQSSSPRERRYSRDEDYSKMLPPPIPKKSASEAHQEQRPSIRHAATTSPTLRRRSRLSKDYQDNPKGPPSPQKEKPNVREPSRRPSVSKRPSGTSSNNSAVSTPAIERDIARLSIDSERAAKPKRRMSYHGHESHRDLERSAEAYQASIGTAMLPMTADSLNLIRKKTTSSNTSSRITGSGRGSREGSDVKPRSSMDRRGGSEVKTHNDNDGLTMRFNASHGVNLDLKGGSVEGRTISLRQSRDGGDGEMEFSIGAKSSKTSSRTESREKGRKKYSHFGGSGIRELEPASSTGRSSSRGVKADEESKSRSRKVAGSRSRRSSRSGHG